MVLLASAYDQSRFLRAEDMRQEKTLRIKKVTEELVGQGADQQKKLVVWFTNDEHGLVLNKTNNRTIRGSFGDDTSGWTNKLIVVYPTTADMRGRMVAALRVRIPPPKPSVAQFDQFASKPAPQAAGPVNELEPPPAEPPEEERDPFDDEIPPL